MKKYLFLTLGLLIALACRSPLPVSVNSVEITPQGADTATTLTAEIEAQGDGLIEVEWYHGVYDTASVVFSERIEVDGPDTYTSVYEADLGWFWVEILDQDVDPPQDPLLWRTDSVFCGPNPTPPKIEFSAEPEQGAYPLTVVFSNQTEKDEYTRWSWDFGDGATDTVWEPVHTYEEPGEYQVVLTVSNLAGSSRDSASINVYEPLAVNSVQITPPGSSDKTTLTAEIEAGGRGTIQVKWFNAVYDTVSLAWTDEIEVAGNGTYSSVFSSGLGWYWVDILDEEDSLLWHTDSVFCGPDSTLPVIEFYPDWEYGPHPLTVTFYNETDKNEYTRAFWDFDDGATSSDWEPTHTYQKAGQFYPKLYVYDLAGSAVDSTLIFVW